VLNLQDPTYLPHVCDRIRKSASAAGTRVLLLDVEARETDAACDLCDLHDGVHYSDLSNLSGIQVR
jgi:hypothetical protein